MGRRDFIRHLNEAGAKGYKYISDIKRGDDDGSFDFTYACGVEKFSVTVYIPDVSAYPNAHQYIIYLSSDDAPAVVTATLERVQEFSTGHEIGRLMGRIEGALERNLRGAGSGSEYPGDCEEDEDNSDDDWDEVGEETNADTENESQMEGTVNLQQSSLSKDGIRKLKRRLKEDIRQVMDAGFRVGLYGDFKGDDHFYLSVSVRVSKLGISDEVLAAWTLDKDEYLVLLIHYSDFYKGLEWLSDVNYSCRMMGEMQMWVGLSKRYKPTPRECLQAFTKIKDFAKYVGADTKASRAMQEEDGDPSDTGSSLHPFFLSNPLKELLNARLVTLVKCRLKGHLNWEGAEAFLKDLESHAISSPDDYHMYTDVKPHPKTVLEPIVTADALSPKSFRGVQTSFPLIAMQYTLRHLVRCTEFCLVCHDKIKSDFEAMKPYVCSSPLCLYQYMALGFGPSIEYEIISQPTVVDLLVSFCYCSSAGRRLVEFPTGMNILVPSGNKFSAGYFASLNLVAFTQGQTPCVKIGDWIFFHGCISMEECHLRVEEVNWPDVLVGLPVRTAFPRPSSVTPPENPTACDSHRKDFPETGNPEHAGIVSVHNTPFDGLSVAEKSEAIRMLLDLLPSVKEMRNWLRQIPSSGEGASLKDWVQRILPSSLSILRWIIASNRSCIVPVDCERDTEGNPITNSRSESRVLGLGDCLQFRFAMGAPDKEQRFVNCVKEVRTRLQLKHPTIFAFHGSPLANWHSIVRSGLHYNTVSHGRAFGNGVYHSLDFRTSMAYSTGFTAPLIGTSVAPVIPAAPPGQPSFSGMPASTARAALAPGVVAPRGSGHFSSSSWSQSSLNLQSAVSLNEIVNAPSEFVSAHPHLVVNQLDWIQTRYLFVMTAGPPTVQPNYRPTDCSVDYLEQDPILFPVGNAGALKVPALVSRYRARSVPTPLALPRGMLPPTPPTAPRALLLGAYMVADIDRMDTTPGTASAPIPIDDDALSDATDATDAMQYFSDDDESPNNTALAADGTKNVIRFTPGMLNMSNIPILPPPTYATSIATKRLTADLHALLKLQSKHPISELGFYINPNTISNVYQWHLELHSFPPHLPISNDLVQKGLSSILLEIRFGPSFPMSPPFIRVVKPRFLAFSAGGGGNVTAGGALCMELLTNSGWTAVSSLESVLLQVRMAICDSDKPARLEPGIVREYSPGEAREAYVRACRNHGWGVPEDLSRMG